ncbi:MAG: DUF6448 family protein [Planctomycetota bacterium]
MRRWNVLTIASFVLVLATARAALAHCDGLDGPVVAAARHALASGNPNLVLIWVAPGSEAEIQRAFASALALRKLGPEAQELADRYFFETVVRIHRAGEGAPFTGLKPAGRDLGPAIPAADRAIEDGHLEPLRELLGETARQGLERHFQEVMANKAFRPDDVLAGRRYVAAYVSYVHFVEELFERASHPALGHFSEHRETGAREPERLVVDRDEPEPGRVMGFDIPAPLRAEHDALHSALARAIESGGKTGEAASAVASILHPHFAAEEEYALPPLGLLAELAAGNLTPRMQDVLSLTDRLRASLPQMLREHEAIVAELAKLAAAAKLENKSEYAALAEQLVHHARTEEEVLYPASLLVGEYLRQRKLTR